jgi:hypothetical protein
MIAGIISVIIGLLLLAWSMPKGEEKTASSMMPKHPLDDYDIVKQEDREKDGEKYKAVIFKKKK